MKRFILICIASLILLRCTSGGSTGGLSGGGVIGNPAMSTFSYTDTIHCKVITDNRGFNLFNKPFAPFMPIGPDTAHTQQKQTYSYPGAPGEKRFRFVYPDGERITAWSKDSVIEWTWTKTGTYSVMVQNFGIADTSVWSVPLIVHVVE
jgi:hypothetical protein